MPGPSAETGRTDLPLAATQRAGHQFYDGAGVPRASGNLLKSWSRRAGEAFLKPCLPVRRQGAVKTATTCRFLLEAPPQSDVGRSGTGHGQTKVLNLKARTRPEYTRTEFQSKPGEFYHEHVRQSHFLECQGIHHPAHLPRTGRQHFQSRNQRASRPTATDL